MRCALVAVAVWTSACTVADPHFFRPDGGGDGPTVDAVDPTDGGPDGPAQASFDVGFVNEWRIGTAATSMSQNAWARVVNTGSASLDLSTATITNVIDNHAQIVVDVTWEGPTLDLAPSMSAGFLSPAATTLIVTNGVVTEPAEETTTSLLHISVTNLPGTWLVDNVEATFQIENARVTLPINLVSSGTGSNSTAFSATRVSSVPL
jgi:hypothetical protein